MSLSAGGEGEGFMLSLVFDTLPAMGEVEQEIREASFFFGVGTLGESLTEDELSLPPRILSQSLSRVSPLQEHHDERSSGGTW